MDGANEERVTVGGVLFDGSCPPEYPSEVVLQPIADKWRSQGGDQVIGQAELLPVLVAATVWKKHVAKRHTTWFIDQDAARRGLTKGCSSALRSGALIDMTTETLAESGPYSWFARVGTASNIADGPSRLSCEELLYWFPDARRRRVKWDDVSGEGN